MTSQDYIYRNGLDTYFWGKLCSKNFEIVIILYFHFIITYSTVYKNIYNETRVYFKSSFSLYYQEHQFQLVGLNYNESFTIKKYININYKFLLLYTNNTGQLT